MPKNTPKNNIKENTIPVEAVEIPAAPITADKLVSDDVDKFPAGSEKAPEQPIVSPPPVEQNMGDNIEPPKKGRGRPKGSKNKEPSFSDVTGEAREIPKQIDYKGMALVCFKLSTNTMAQIFGPEWLPMQPQPGMPGEEEMVVGALATYLEKKQMPDIPPGVMLALICSMYCAPRFRAPSTRDKISGVWQWVKRKFRKKEKSVKSENARQPEKTESEEKTE